MDDPYDLQRFVDAHEQAYSSAIAEIRAGRKRSHWMWFIFPQFAGLGSSAMSQRYAIRSSQEAKAYLLHPQLGERLIACAESLLALHGLTCQQIFGAPDDMKLRSCATLFAQVTPANSVFEQLLDKYFGGARDEQTLQLMRSDAPAG
ncbi:MAG: DUF1810 domain-containing protein [Planctomycetia bacterium]|nr:DUF1810 domain-containing protein [Planctomycetia bacterium]